MCTGPATDRAGLASCLNDSLPNAFFSDRSAKSPRMSGHFLFWPCQPAINTASQRRRRPSRLAKNRFGSRPNPGEPSRAGRACCRQAAEVKGHRLAVVKANASCVTRFLSVCLCVRLWCVCVYVCDVSVCGRRDGERENEETPTTSTGTERNPIPCDSAFPRDFRRVLSVHKPVGCKSLATPPPYSLSPPSAGRNFRLKVRV